jgi:hypothetical protein
VATKREGKKELFCPTVFKETTESSERHCVDVNYFIEEQATIPKISSLPVPFPYSRTFTDAIRRDSSRGLVYISLTTVQGISLVLVGTGFKLLLTEGASDHHQSYVWLLSAAFVVYFLATFFIQMNHNGMFEEFVLLETAQLKRKRAALWALKLAVTWAALAAPSFYTASSWAPLLFLWLLASVGYIVQLADLREFRDHHQELVKREVEERQRKFPSPPVSSELKNTL